MDAAMPEQYFARLRELREAYMAPHRAGMEALERHDLVALEAAIEAEREVIEAQRVLIAELRAWTESRDGS